MVEVNNFEGSTFIGIIPHERSIVNAIHWAQRRYIEPVIGYNTINRRSGTGIYGSNGGCTIGLNK